MNLGYANVPLVEDRGTFSVRGGILDIFPPDLPQPVRIEFFGDFVDTIRTFDPVTQRSLHPLTELVLLPSREVILPEEKMPEFAARLKSRCDDLDLPADRRRGLLEQLQNSIFPPGIEYLQPLFHPDLETLFDYAGTGVSCALVDPEAVAATTEPSLRNWRDGGAARPGTGRRSSVLPRNFSFPKVRWRNSSARRRLSIPYLEITEAEVTGTTFRFAVENNSDLKLDLSPGQRRGAETAGGAALRLAGRKSAGSSWPAISRARPKAP